MWPDCDFSIWDFRCIAFPTPQCYAQGSVSVLPVSTHRDHSTGAHELSAGISGHVLGFPPRAWAACLAHLSRAGAGDGQNLAKIFKPALGNPKRWGPGPILTPLGKWKRWQVEDISSCHSSPIVCPARYGDCDSAPPSLLPPLTDVQFSCKREKRWDTKMHKNKYDL